VGSFVGGSWGKRDKKWMVVGRDKGKNKHIGYYDDETAAARAFDAYAIAKKINADLNFPSAPGAAGHRTTKTGRTSSHRGVCWHKRAKKWMAAIYVDGKKKYLGIFVDEDDAGRAYDTAVRKHFPVERPHKWKRFNFPSADGEEGSADGGDDAGSARGWRAAAPRAAAPPPSPRAPRRRRRRRRRRLPRLRRRSARAAAVATTTAIPGP
jgi:hypothetical protein